MTSPNSVRMAVATRGLRLLANACLRHDGLHRTLLELLPELFRRHIVRGAELAHRGLGDARGLGAALPVLGNLVRLERILRLSLRWNRTGAPTRRADRRVYLRHELLREIARLLAGVFSSARRKNLRPI